MRKFADDEYLNDDFMKQILTIIIALFMALVAVAQNELVYSESLERLAAGGNAVAQNNLGIVYQQGSGVGRDLEKAAYWFQKGAENGSAPAMSNLGTAYLKGQGVERNLDADPSESFSDKEVNLKTNRLLKGRIQSFMAMCYRQGVGTAPDMQKAMEYMKLAADNDNPEGCLIMSQAYETSPRPSAAIRLPPPADTSRRSIFWEAAISRVKSSDRTTVWPPDISEWLSTTREMCLRWSRLTPC